MKNLSKKRAIKLIMSKGIGKRKAEVIVKEMRYKKFIKCSYNNGWYRPASIR